MLPSTKTIGIRSPLDCTKAELLEIAEAVCRLEYVPVELEAVFTKLSMDMTEIRDFIGAVTIPFYDKPVKLWLVDWDNNQCPPPEFVGEFQTVDLARAEVRDQKLRQGFAYSITPAVLDDPMAAVTDEALCQRYGSDPVWYRHGIV